MCFIRSLDCYESVGVTFRTLASIFTGFNFPKFIGDGITGLGLNAAGYAGASIGLIITILVSVLQRKGEDIRDVLSRKKAPVRYIAVCAVFFAVLIFGAYGQGYDATQFIYGFRF
jgi:hypothetical protein